MYFYSNLSKIGLKTIGDERYYDALNSSIHKILTGKNIKVAMAGMGEVLASV